jgi:CRP/FNR family cyclic AMP-dependent transcriptional regulator
MGEESGEANSGFGFGAEERDLFLKRGRRRDYAKGSVIFGEGQEVEAAYLVEEGRVNILKAASGGAEALLGSYGPGRTFCLAAFINHRPYPCRAVAATDCRLQVLAAAELRPFYSQLPEVGRRLLADLACQVCDAYCHCAELLESVDRRLATTLLRLDRQSSGGAIPHTRQELAQMTNTTVESCIRTLSSWSRQGFVSGSRGRLRVLDRPALEALAGGSAAPVRLGVGPLSPGS